MNEVAKSLEELLNLIREGKLVRDIGQDFHSDWMILAADIVRTIGKAEIALHQYKQEQAKCTDPQNQNQLP